MQRRDFLRTGILGAAAMLLPTGGRMLAADPPAWPVEKDLKITGVRLVKTKPKYPLPSYTPDPGSYWMNREAARPIEFYPKYTGRRGRGSKWMPDPGKLSSFVVEIETDKGLKGYGQGGPAGGQIVEGHLKKLLLGENPMDTERLWDVMWRASLYYGRAGAAVHAISGVDVALWDIVGKAFGVPVYKLLGGRAWDRVPAYATGNDVEQSAAFGYTKVKLALPHGPSDGREGIKKNVALVKRARDVLGPDGEIMIDCWMALTEAYTLQLAEALEPYRVLKTNLSRAVRDRLIKVFFSNLMRSDEICLADCVVRTVLSLSRANMAFPSYQKVLYNLRLFLLGLVAFSFLQFAKAERPSVLFLNIDDWNDWNSVLDGHPQAITPNLERFAERSVTFTRAICSSPVCFPSRTSIFSGLHPVRTGAKSNWNWGRPWRSYVPDAITLPKFLSARGWKSVGIGKNFHNGDEAEFDEYTRRGKEPKPIPETFRNVNSSGRWGVASVPTHEMHDYLSVSQGIEALESNPGGLFLALGIYRPHVPWVVPQEYFDRYPLDTLLMPERQEDDLDDLPERFKTIARAPAKFGPGYHEMLEAKGYDREKVQAYLACVSFADDQVGRILDAWYASPHSENGYVILWSDHGYQLSEKEGWSKMKPWYDSARVNLMIAGPGLAEGEFCNKAVSLLDLYPTLVELLGIAAPPQGLDGNSLVPLLKDPQADWDKPVLMSSEEEGIRYDVVLSNDYRMTRMATGETELYHLDSDPHEFTNLAGKPGYEGVIAKLSDHLSLRQPEPDAEGWLEAEDLPHQTSSDFDKRGNFHYPQDRSDASQGVAVSVHLIKGADSYIEFVLNIDRPGDYDLSLSLSAEGSCTLLTAPVVNDAKQADEGYPMKKLMSIEKTQSETFDLVSAGVIRFDQAGLHLLRLSSQVPKQQLTIDRIRLLSRN